MGCLVKRNESHSTVQQIWNHTKTIYVCVDWRIFCSLKSEYSGVISNGYFQPMPFLALSYAPSLTTFICSLCLSLPLFRLLPTLFYLLQLHIKWCWYSISGIIEKPYLNKRCFSLMAWSLYNNFDSLSEGEVSLYNWPPVWLVWICLFCK